MQSFHAIFYFVLDHCYFQKAFGERHNGQVVVFFYRETGEQGWKVFRQVNPLADMAANQDLLQDPSVSLTWLWHMKVSGKGRESCYETFCPGAFANASKHKIIMHWNRIYLNRLAAM